MSNKSSSNLATGIIIAVVTGLVSIAVYYFTEGASAEQDTSIPAQHVVLPGQGKG